MPSQQIQALTAESGNRSDEKVDRSDHRFSLQKWENESGWHFTIPPPQFHSDTRRVSWRRLQSDLQVSSHSCIRPCTHLLPDTAPVAKHSSILVISLPRKYFFPVRPRQWPSTLPEGWWTATNLSNQVINYSISAKVPFDDNIYQQEILHPAFIYPNV